MLAASLCPAEAMRCFTCPALFLSSFNFVSLLFLPTSSRGSGEASMLCRRDLSCPISLYAFPYHRFLVFHFPLAFLPTCAPASERNTDLPHFFYVDPLYPHTANSLARFLHTTPELSVSSLLISCIYIFPSHISFLQSYFSPCLNFLLTSV